MHIHHIQDQDIFSPLPTPEDMTAWDAAAVRDFRIPEFTLMENAGREAFHVIQTIAGQRRSVLTFTGGGNNGGDGAAVSRLLHDAGHKVLVCHTRPPDTMRGAAGEHARLARQCGVAFTPVLFEHGNLIVPEEWRDVATAPDIVIDALLGTGFRGHLQERELQLVRHMNMLRRRSSLIALDIPSGLDARTGIPQPEAVHALHTITFEAAKTGIILPHAAPFVGKLHERPIGIPAMARLLHPAQFLRILPQPGVLRHISPGMHKGNAGHVLVIGGSETFTGAPLLAALGALRCGAGLVTLAYPGGLASRIAGIWPEVMHLPLGGENNWQKNLTPVLLQCLCEQKFSVLVVGPGMGRGSDAAAIIELLLASPERPPLILDADGLFPLSARGNAPSPLLSLLKNTDCITPHPGEAARILGIDTDQVQEDRFKALGNMTEQCAAVVVLKGAGALVGQRGAPTAVAPFAAPALAVGGSGDILAGACAALRASGYLPLHAACLGVYVHGRAGEMLTARYPARGNLAREIADVMPDAMAELG